MWTRNMTFKKNPILIYLFLFSNYKIFWRETGVGAESLRQRHSRWSKMPYEELKPYYWSAVLKICLLKIVCAVRLTSSFETTSLLVLGRQRQGRWLSGPGQAVFQPVPHSETFSKDKTNGGFVFMANPSSDIFQKYPERWHLNFNSYLYLLSQSIPWVR